MAINKICGIETEFGIVHTGYKDASSQLNPIAASSVLINAYVSDTFKQSPKWNFEGETPSQDARGSVRLHYLIPEVETQFMNVVLTNGARYYVDHAHPEFSSPECRSVLSALLYDRAGEEILKKSMELVQKKLPEGEEIVVYKNNSDGKRNSYGCHENYLMDRAIPFSKIITGASAHFITRQIYTGAGKVGAELTQPEELTNFQISQRADFIEEEVGLETTLKRPIINTRDEPHSFANLYRRFHVIVGDANMSQTATFLKLGSTAFVLSMIEDNFWEPSFEFAEPVTAFRQVSKDLFLNAPLTLKDGSSITALEAQWEIFNHAQKYSKADGIESIGEAVGEQVLEIWEEVLHGLETDPLSLGHRLDWVAKYNLLESYRQRHNLEWDDARLFALNLQYHDLRPQHSVVARLNLDELVSTQEVAHAVTEPPTDTRAYFRGKCLQKFADDIISINWDSIIFRRSDNSLERIEMMEPSKGTEALTAELFSSSNTFENLIGKVA